MLNFTPVTFCLRLACGLGREARFVVPSSSVAALFTFCDYESWCFAPLAQVNADADALPLRGNASSSQLLPLTLIVLHQRRGLFWHQSDLSLKKRGGGGGGTHRPFGWESL